MQIKIQATGIALTPEVEAYIEKRIGSISKFLGKNAGAALAEVEVGRVSQRHRQGEIFRAEANLTMPGMQLRATSEAEDIHAAIDDIKEELEREFISSKDKERTLFRRGALVIKDLVRGFGKWKWKRIPKLPKFKRRNK